MKGAGPGDVSVVSEKEREDLKVLRYGLFVSFPQIFLKLFLSLSFSRLATVYMEKRSEAS